MPEQNSNLEAIYQWIVERTAQKGRVLDIGCGDGELLARLVTQRGVHGTGIEISEECVVRAVQRGLSVHHGNVEEGLDHYDDGAFDLVIMSLIVQEMKNPLAVINEAFRVGRQVVVVIPNFGCWSSRTQLMFRGKAPQTGSFPYAWYDSPNRHFFTITDWRNLCRRQNWNCVAAGFASHGKLIGFWPNLRSEVAMYLLEKGGPDHEPRP